MPEIFVGSAVRFSLTVQNSSDVAIDPSALQLDLTGPFDSASFVYGTDAELIRDSLGNFHLDYVIPGAKARWSWRWLGSGAVGAGADYGTFEVKA